MLPQALNIDEVVKPLREALQPKGTSPLCMLKLSPGCAVQASLAQQAIDEIVVAAKYSRLVDPETACMRIAKLVLMDSANLNL